MPSGSGIRWLLGALDWVRKTLLGPPATEEEVAKHLEVGEVGEEIAYFYLRQIEYTVVARNWRNSRRNGELDIVAWDSDGSTLCFVEVKTRTKKTIVPAELAVDNVKRRELTAMARLYLQQMPVGTRFRFDIVTVYMHEGREPEITHFKDAFGWKTRTYGSGSAL